MSLGMSYGWEIPPRFEPRLRGGRRPTSGTPGSYCSCCWRSASRKCGCRPWPTRTCGSCCYIGAALVRLRTKVRNQLDAIAKNEGLVGQRIGTRKGRQQLAALPLSGWYQQRRQDLFELLDRLEERIAPLNQAVQQAAEERVDAQRLMTHPGVGPVVALAYVLAIGDWQRFPRGKYVASYLGLIPEEASSSNARRLGHITKQGNSLVRRLLVEAATKAQQCDPAWHRQYLRLARNKHHGVAKVAIARKLAIRLYWMLRSGQDYEQVKERSSHAGQSVEASGHSLRRPTF